jgi:phosphoglycolate phosphatase
MGKRFDLLVFDWDGTLVDSAGHIVDSIQAAARDIGLREPTVQDALHIIGLGLVDAMTYLFPELSREDYPRLAERYRFHYLAADHKVALFPGTHEAIRSWHATGFNLAVATGKSRQGLDRALKTSGLTRYFHATRCADEGFAKPHPDMLLWLIDRLYVDPERTVMIGDTTHDLQMARQAGVSAVAVAYGAHPRDQLESLSPLACVGSTAELVQWLNENA